MSYNAAGSTTVFPDLTGPSGYTGSKLTNALGFIRRDATFSVVDAQKVTEVQDCSCFVERTQCLKLACDLDSQNGNNCLTTPLVDPTTGEPFKLTKGSLIQDIIVGKRKGACVDPNACILVGVIKDTNDDCCADHCAQRWISEANVLTGDVLNGCGVVKVDATCNCKACCLFNANDCGSNTCEDFCEDDCEVTCTQPPDEPCAVQCLDPKMELQKRSGLCIGENEDLYLAVTLVNGCLKEHDISLAIKIWGQAEDCGFCGDFSPFPQSAVGASTCTLFSSH